MHRGDAASQPRREQPNTSVVHDRPASEFDLQVAGNSYSMIVAPFQFMVCVSENYQIEAEKTSCGYGRIVLLLQPSANFFSMLHTFEARDKKIYYQEYFNCEV